MIQTERVRISTGSYYGKMRDTGAYALMSQANEMAAAGVWRAEAEVSIRIPADMDKSRWNSIRNHTKRAVTKLEEEGFQVENLSIEGGANAALRVPEVTVTMAGLKEKREEHDRKPLVGQDILTAGWIGLEGMLRVIGEREGELKERFSLSFMRQMKSYDKELCGMNKVDAADAMGVSAIRQISEGGILASLWNLAKETEAGLEINLKKIPVRQETIEVCEHFRLNPYQLTSCGCFLMIAENGEAVADALNQKGVCASVIGRLTDSNDKVIHNGEDMRYIDRPAPDELFKIL